MVMLSILFVYLSLLGGVERGKMYVWLAFVYMVMLSFTLVYPSLGLPGGV